MKLYKIVDYEWFEFDRYALMFRNSSEPFQAMPVDENKLHYFHELGTFIWRKKFGSIELLSNFFRQLFSKEENMQQD